MTRLSFKFIAATLLVLSAAACQKDTDFDLGDGNATNETLLVETDDSKVFMNENNYKLWWKANDNIKMITDAASDGVKTYKNALNGNDSALNVIINSKDGSDFSFKKKCYGFYPEFEFTPVMDGSQYATDANGDPIVVVNLEQQQVLDNDRTPLFRLHLTRYPRACKSVANYNKYDFKNLCGTLVFFLKSDASDGDDKIEEIRFEADQYSNGQFEISWTGSGTTWEPVLTPVNPTDDNKVTRLKFNERVDISSGRQFFLALPQTTTPHSTKTGKFVYTNCKITITTANNHVKVLRYPEITITRNKMTRLVQNSEITPNTSLNNFDTKSGLFTVAQQSFGYPTKKVYFSPGNLQFKNTNWQFAAQQYEVLHGYTGSSYTTSSSNYSQDLFGWSTTNSSCGQSELPGNYTDNQLDSPFLDWGRLAFGPNSPWYTMPVEEWEVLLYKRKTDFSLGGTTIRWVAATMGHIETSEYQYYYDWGGRKHIYDPTIENETENGILDHGSHTESVIYEKNRKEGQYYTTETSTIYVYEEDGILIFPDEFTASNWNSATNSASIPNNARNKCGNHPDMNGNNMEMVMLSKQQLKNLEEVGVVWLPAAGKAALNSTVGSTVGSFAAPNTYSESALYYWTASPYVQMRNENGATTTPGNASSAFQLYVHNNSSSYAMNGQDRTDRCAVRLVRQAPSTDWNTH